MVFAPFNHGGLLHLGANMFALFSISGIMERFVAPEQFTAFYLSSGKLNQSIFYIGIK